MVQAKMTAAQAETMFHTSMSRFVSGSVMTVRTLEFTVPESIAQAVSVVGDLVHFPAVPSQPPKEETGRRLLGGGGGGAGKWDNACTGTGGTACKGLVTPAVLKTRYKLPDAPAKASGNNSMAVAEFQGQYYNTADLGKFADGCKVSAPTITDFGKNKESAGVESMLDIEYISAIANPIPLQVWYQQEYSLLSWIKTGASTANAAPTPSVSYGNDEIQQTGAKYMNQVNVQFQQIGTRGITVLFASGDQGVWGRSGHGSRFHPDFPGGSPYITVVGGTDFVTDDIGDEKVWASGGGGFSDTFARPSYQDSAVQGYLTNPAAALPPASYFNKTGRGYPDVAALGGQKTPYCVNAGRFEGVAGTSASCPVVAGVFALLNDARIAEGKPPLGFLNPLIYQNAAAFNDVTQGKNNAGSGEGFTATKGWDAASGMGTPDYSKLLAVVKALP
jgi:tripeptidyl-peptidase-1